MNPLKLSEQEKKNLRNKAKAELEQLELCLSNQAVIQMLDDFKNKFNICETVYKVVLAEHQKRKGKLIKENLNLDMRQVPHALAFAGYSFSKDLLTELFGSSSQKGRTVKQLCDAIAHGLNPKTVAEITNRREELFGYMESFLSQIRNFDSAAS